MTLKYKYLKMQHKLSLLLKTKKSYLKSSNLFIHKLNNLVKVNFIPIHLFYFTMKQDFSRFFVVTDNYNDLLNLNIKTIFIVFEYSLKGGDPAAPSDTATLLRLNPSHWFYLRQLPPTCVGQLTDFGYPQLPWLDGRCVQDPRTHSPRRADPGLLATPASCGRVAAHNLNWERFFEFGSMLPYCISLYRPLQHVCSPRRKRHDDLTSSPPSSVLPTAVFLECPT